MMINNNLSYLFNTSEDVDSLLKTLRKYEKRNIKYLYSFNYLDISVKTVIRLVEKNPNMNLEELASHIYYVIHN